MKNSLGEGINMVLFDQSKKTLEDVVQNCTHLIERDAMVAGAGNRMSSPLLSVFLGSGAVEHIYEIESTYFSCWSAEARKLEALQGIYTQQQISDKIARASRVKGNYQSRSTLRIVWYWDIMGDDFDAQFECVQKEVPGVVGMQIVKNYFIFCSQSNAADMEKTEQRLQKLIEWNKERRDPMMILSDATRRGLLDDRGIAENYHMAASTVLMLNSVDANDLGVNLDFKMRKQHFWTASYCVCSKNFFDIISVSLLRIIRKYQEVSRDGTGSRELQSRICGEGGNYLNLLDDLFDEVLAPLCPVDQQIAFWEDLPLTGDMAALKNKLAGVRTGGFLSRLMGSRNAGDPANAIPSVQDFWDACVERYYLKPVRDLMETEEGLQKILGYLYGRMTSVLTLSDMKKQLPAEWAKLERDMLYQNPDFERDLPESGISLAQYLHDRACVRVKREYYGNLLKYLVEIMKELNANSDGFEGLLANVAASIEGIDMDRAISKAYGYHMDRVIESNKQVLNQKLHPCATEEALLGQLESAFTELVRLDRDGVYYYTLQEDIDFQIKTGFAAQNNVIANCFTFDMTTAGRLVTTIVEPGDSYCMMNNRLKGLVQGQDIGTQFIVNRCDRIERLYLYPVDPDKIRYRG